MKHNTLIGLVLIGLIMIGFSWYNTKQLEKQKAYQFTQDSLARVQALQYAEEMAVAQAQNPTQDQAQITSSDSVSGYSYTYANPFLEKAYVGEEQSFTIENNNLKIVYSSLGAQAKEVNIKNYQTADKSELIFLKENSSTFGMQLYAGQNISTENFVFELVENTDSTLVMKLPFSETSSLVYSYYLAKDSYMVDFNIEMIQMDRILPRNMSHFDINWKMDIPRLEKGYDNEKNYSTIVYKYPKEDGVETLGLRKDAADENISTKFAWFAFQQQFFAAILLADNNFASGDLSYTFHDEFDEENRLVACNASTQVEYNASKNVIPFKFYYGPNHFKTLKSYDQGFEKIVPLGGWLIGWINRFVIIQFFDFLSKFFSNYGIIILIMTIILKIILSPLTIKSYTSSAKMAVLRPEVEKINAKYPKPEDAMKKQQEVSTLYRNAGVNILSGCIPTLLQMPILFAMFRFFPSSFELRQQSFLWAKDLSAYDSILDLGFNIPLYGDHVSLFAILMAISMFVMSKINSAQMDSSGQMAGMKFMTLYFVIISQVPCVIIIY